jgi:3-phosphoshikimate 1-carboxyvinyltransferase
MQWLLRNRLRMFFQSSRRSCQFEAELVHMGGGTGAAGRARPSAGGKLHGAKVHGWHDHRIVMALTVVGLVPGRPRSILRRRWM